MEVTMSARKATMIAALLSVALLAAEESALAQEERDVAQSQDFNCSAINAQAHDTWPGAGNVSTGVIRHSGRLNGTTQYVYDTDGFTTPDANMVTFGAGLTITTRHGMAKARVVFLFNIATGIWTSIATIDPNTSTGRFVGARGTLWYPNGTTINLDNGAQVYPSDLTGHLCLATQRRDNNDHRK
jgi:hypothetical protein